MPSRSPTNPNRPWPAPEAPWLMKQKWERLLFAHWRVNPDDLRPVMPANVPIDTFDGSAWISVTPFRVRGLRGRLMPPLPYVSRFLEINVRTYTTFEGKPGIWFFSLDTERQPAVLAARRGYRLPYFHAEMRWSVDGEHVDYESRREGAEFRAGYRPGGDVYNAEPGTLDYFLTERYCLYTLNEEQQVLRADIDHPPWPLQPAEAEIELNTMGEQIGIELDGEPLLQIAMRQDVVFWPLVGI